MKEKVKRSRGGAYVNSTLKRSLIICLIFILTAILWFSYKTFNEKNIELSQKLEKIEKLEMQIDEEDEKLKQAKKQENKVITNEDIESIAREELGLIKRDEIVIKPN